MNEMERTDPEAEVGGCTRGLTMEKAKRGLGVCGARRGLGGGCARRGRSVVVRRREHVFRV
ncbi:hypothetical protein HID58_064905 [Brassica napus]|uniref:Uncharacterized protein n=1 Tax=Brassica napus TaxID=3708 RepID=A0ABQ7ZBA6_BRANA|nr:hypothetical protein HID58_064905 [Brassica napus]